MPVDEHAAADASIALLRQAFGVVEVRATTQAWKWWRLREMRSESQAAFMLELLASMLESVLAGTS